MKYNSAISFEQMFVSLSYASKYLFHIGRFKIKSDHQTFSQNLIFVLQCDSAVFTTSYCNVFLVKEQYFGKLWGSSCFYDV